MNRRLFLRTGLLTLLAAATGAAAAAPDPIIYRRVDIERDGGVLRNQPFRALRKGDVFVILGAEDVASGQPYRAMTELGPSHLPGLLGCEAQPTDTWLGSKVCACAERR